MKPSDAIYKSIVHLNETFNKYKKQKSIDNPVIIGRTPTSSHVFENKLAEELAVLYPDYKFLVDYPMQLDKKTFYPDIAIIKKIETYVYELICIVDIKIDLGYIDENYYYSDISENSFAHRESFLSNSNNPITFKVPTGRQKALNIPINKFCLWISPSLKKICVVGTTANAHRRVDKHKTSMEQLGYEVFYLSHPHHPNDGFELKTNNEFNEYFRKISDKLDIAFTF